MALQTACKLSRVLIAMPLLYRSGIVTVQYDVADYLARLLAKRPAWQSASKTDDEAIGRFYDNRADFLTERYLEFLASKAPF